MDMPSEDIFAADIDVLEQIEAILDGESPAPRQLELAIRELGEHLGASRVVLYGDSDAGDDAVRVRSEWHAPGEASLPRFASPLPLLTLHPSEDTIVSAWPRGEHCQQDCPTTAAACPLRHACASIVEPLRVGGRRYGRLGVHAITHREWTMRERLLVRQIAIRLALHIAQRRTTRLQDQLEAQRRGIAMTVLHQIATPVSVVGGTLDHVWRYGTEGNEALLTAADDAVAHLRRLCDDLIAITAGSSGAPVSRDVRRELDAVVDGARRRHPGCAIELDAPAHLPLVRVADGEVARALDALVDNAFRYGGEQAHVTVAAWADEEVITIRVRDDGPGVLADSIDVVGAAFSRDDPSMRRLAGGAGLGLALATTIARRAGGELQLTPRGDAVGAQATLCLPRAAEDCDDVSPSTLWA